MSGSNEERPAAADEPAARAVEETGEEVEMTAAEALLRATRAAAEEESQAAPEPPPEAGGGREAAAAPDAEAASGAEQRPRPEADDGGGGEAPAPVEEPAPAEVSSEEGKPSAESGPDTGQEPPAGTAGVEAEAEEPEPASGAESTAGGKGEKPARPAAPSPEDRPELRVVREALANRQPLEGRVIGWNNGGFHLALGELSAFCPRSEMEIGEVEEPESYLDQTFLFRVLRLQGKGRRIVVSRAAQLRGDKARQRSELRKKLQPGAVLDGTVASLTAFGVFVDLGGAQGLVHVSEISHRRVEHPGDVLSEGQEVRVKVLKIEQGGRRISLSIRALEPDPWRDLASRFPRGVVVEGTVERANQIGAFIELAPGLTGLLPAKAMSIPRETTPARAYPPGKKVSVQIVSIDPRRQRISLALEGSGLEGSRSDYQEYQRKRREAGEGGGFNALATALRRLRDD